MVVRLRRRADRNHNPTFVCHAGSQAAAMPFVLLLCFGIRLELLPAFAPFRRLDAMPEAAVAPASAAFVRLRVGKHLVADGVIRVVALAGPLMRRTRRSKDRRVFRFCALGGR